MLKYLKYYLSTALIVLAIFVFSLGPNYPTFFFIGFSLFVVLGDLILPKDIATQKYSLPKLINLPIYMNFPLLLIFLVQISFVMGSNEPAWVSNSFVILFNIDLISMKQGVTVLDQVALIGVGSLYLGMIGTVPGHELTHRKKDRFDMFFGNWLLSFSWDCAFALEHVYGHHKNVGLPSDPATAKRGENIYMFMIRASVQEHLDAWKIELSHLRRRGKSPYGFHNKMIIGYLRSSVITFIAYIAGGVIGMLFYLLIAAVAKGLLEAINYVEHYGLVRVPDTPVYPRHSWNSNDVISSLLLYNVTRHSAHHEKSNLKFWELDSYPDAPTMPYGYLTMLYIAVFAPYYFHYIMKPKLKEWDESFASDAERQIVAT